MKTIKIHGKDYVPVSERVKFLASDKENVYSIETEYFYYPEDGRTLWVVKATLTLNGNTYTGHAQEVETSDEKKINHTSVLENCETSAVGRALAMAGIGVVDSIASADEMRKVKREALQDDSEIF
jgi:hypothetical protein